MNWLSRLFNSPAVNAKLQSQEAFESLSEELISPASTEQGFIYSYPNLDKGRSQLGLMDWALDLDTGTQQALYLVQLTDEGLAIYENGKFEVYWEDCYYISQSSEHKDSYRLLNIPSVKSSTWKLSEIGTVSDKKFKIVISGIEDQSQRVQQINRVGALCKLGNRAWLLSPQEWILIKKIDSFSRLKDSEKSQLVNETNWGEIRLLALSCNASLSKYLKETIVITKDTIDILFSKGTYVGVDVVTIEPSFPEDQRAGLKLLTAGFRISSPKTSTLQPLEGGYRSYCLNRSGKFYLLLNESFPLGGPLARERKNS